MLKIFKSNRIENLTDTLVSVLNKKHENPMISEWIGVQSLGMKQWLSLKIAKNLGICTNTSFLFPRQMIDIIFSCFKPLKKNESINQDILFWNILKILNEKNLPELKNYITNDDNKVFQLSVKIAKTFDDYQIYRTYMLLNWAKNKVNTKKPYVKWQKDIWTNINDIENSFSFKADFFLKNFSDKNIDIEKLAPRISFFGISFMPEIFLQLFEKISKIIDMNFFLLVPSNQFFLDIKSAKQINKIAVHRQKDDIENLYFETTNPLLASLGKSGKDFFSLIEQFNYYEPPINLKNILSKSRKFNSDNYDPTSLFYDPANNSKTMLNILQSDILNLVKRDENSKINIETKPLDTSISIHSCYSPSREIQVLKDLLLYEFEQDKTLCCDDIIVMMPDIEAYAPYIESIFLTDKPLLPFCISDRTKKLESEPLNAFLKILELRNKRLEQDDILDLLMSKSIAQKFDINTDLTEKTNEIKIIKEILDKADILWGKDIEHKKHLGLPEFKENTWQFGLQRLLMGIAMPEDSLCIVKSILPSSLLNEDDIKVLNKFILFYHKLFDCLEKLKNNKTIKKWCETLNTIQDLLLDKNSENTEDILFLQQTIQSIDKDSTNASFIDTINFDIIFFVLEQKLSLKTSNANFMSGNITFCNIMPMRSLPFKIVILMGMDEKSFPRQEFLPDFNLIKQNPKIGDKSQRDEDKYLFLESLLSARKKFIVTYTGMDIQNNSKLLCSSVVNELIDTMEQSFVFNKEYKYFFSHRLHAFDEHYFNKKDPFFSFSITNCLIAKKLLENKAKKDPNSFLKKASEPINFKLDPKSKIEPDLKTNLKTNIPIVNLDNIIRFFQHPLKYYVTQNLKIQLPMIKESTKNKKDFNLSVLDQYKLGNFLIDNKSFSKEKSNLIFKTMGKLPFGHQGDLEYKVLFDKALPLINAAKEFKTKKNLPSITQEKNINGILRIFTSFSNIKEDGLYFIDYGKLNGQRLLWSWISHLFLNICKLPLKYPKKTILICLDDKNEKFVKTCSFNQLKYGKALKYFIDLVNIYLDEKPFCFFKKTSWEFAKTIFKKDPNLLFKLKNNEDLEQVLKDLNKAKSQWDKSEYGGIGDKQDRYIDFCFKEHDLFEDYDLLSSLRFAQNSAIVYQPLLKNCKGI